jgi:hypothetical protein
LLYKYKSTNIDANAAAEAEGELTLESLVRGLILEVRRAVSRRV